ncbi:hypothetical protein G7Z17_g162 [Cylindrodendrum hubeiense]|uniref:Uncharacterized protein n=1 Tax=Cylindrodendrum hubeiense TaxID=595255 RepID=A0A9P5HNY6_9HYPO|nr:hypothetical protein G7Z17_g162 [Cylindrodendrum hubeiense]
MEKTRQDTLQAYFASPNATLRPILTSLNGDNSWLISLPRPSAERAGRTFYHVVFEPWLAGPTSILSSWFIGITLPQLPNIPDPQAIEGAIRQIEEAAAALVTQSSEPIDERSDGDYTGGIDAILLQFHFADHIHEATLRLFHENIPVIATPEAIEVIKPWGHFKTITTIQNLDVSSKTWRDSALHPGDPVPSWFTPIRIPGHAELNFCTAMIWSHLNDNGEEVHEAIFNSPHGTRLDEGPLQAFLDAEPQTEKLAMLHGLKESHTAWWQTTLGVKGGLAFYRRLGGVKYWLPSHHSSLAYSGIFMRLSRTLDTARTMEWGLNEEKKERGEGDEELNKPNLVEVENGGCVILES